ncbi:MAG: glycosyltransferase family 39 protein [Hormoscilla sp.]
MKHQEKVQFHLLVLLGWMAIAAILRLTNLGEKPPWADEFSTLVFSLGRGFRTVHLDQVITSDTLLAPLKPNPVTDVSAVVRHLMSETNHPPVYFMLNHLWLQLFPGELVSLWGARSLSALLGIISIPAIFGFSWLTFRSVKVCHLAAVLMAVSPYGIYLAQDARHYTLAILLIIASLSCLILATQAVKLHRTCPIWSIFIWVNINSLGMAVHYFFILVIAAESLVIFYLLIRHRNYPHWGRLGATAAGTAIGVLVWLPVWQNIPGSQLTRWIYHSHSFGDFLAPVARILAWTTTMLFVVPVEGQTLPVILISALAIIFLLFFTVRLLIQGIKISPHGFPIAVLGGFLLGAIALIFGLTYGLGIDLTLVARYQFVYFPAAIALCAGSFASFWHDPTQRRGVRSKVVAADPPQTPPCKRGGFRKPPFLRGVWGDPTTGKIHERSTGFDHTQRRGVAIILLAGLIGGLMVVTNLAYQKPDRPDLVVADILETSNLEVPVLIATVHKTHEQTGEMMGLAWELTHLDRNPLLVGGAHPTNATTFDRTRINFLLAHKEDDPLVATQTLQQTLDKLPKPLELWVVNFSASVKIKAQGCIKDKKSIARVAGYRYRRYHCSAS